MLRLTWVLPLMTGLVFGQATLERDLAQWQAQGVSATDAQILARVSALQSGYQGMVPRLGGFSASDYQANREFVRRSLAWLALVESRGYANPALGRSIAGMYGYLGDYGARPEFRRFGYWGGPAYGYAGAGRLYRRMWLGSGGSLYERDYERYALQLATFGGSWGGGYWGRGWAYYRRPEGLDAIDLGPVIDHGRKQLAVPAVNLAKLSAAEKEQWEEIKPQFVTVSSQIHQALVNLDSLGDRLKRQGMDVNTVDKTNAVLMESFLQDGADLIQAGDFENAKRALTKAGYVRARLKSVVGGG